MANKKMRHICTFLLVLALTLVCIGDFAVQPTYAASSTKTVTKRFSVTKSLYVAVIGVKATVNTKTKKITSIKKVWVLNEAGRKTSKINTKLLKGGKSVNIKGIAIVEARQIADHQGIVPVPIDKTFSYSQFMNLSNY